MDIAEAEKPEVCNGVTCDEEADVAIYADTMGAPRVAESVSEVVEERTTEADDFVAEGDGEILDAKPSTVAALDDKVTSGVDAIVPVDAFAIRLDAIRLEALDVACFAMLEDLIDARVLAVEVC